jgi:hypothetical protein
MTRLYADGIQFLFDAETGLLEELIVTDTGRRIAPLHRAPWVGTVEVMPKDAPPLMAKLGGDFFCAPFAQDDGGSGLHGWPPNSSWIVFRADEGVLRAVLEKPVRGATLVKEISVRNDHPFVYQRHAFVGGSGKLTVSNHANVSVRSGAIIRTSLKKWWETPKDPQESDPSRGRSQLVSPARSEDPTCFPGLEGPVDLTTYPWGSHHEDFVVAIEAEGHALGWVAVTRPAERDVFFSLRNPRVTPMSMLWHSNGGRDYAPWAGRHVGCLGVEEGAASHMLGLSTEDDLPGPGALTLSPDSTTEVRHVIGAIDWPSGEPVADLVIDGNSLLVSGEGGEFRTVPFNAAFLRLEDPA